MYGQHARPSLVQLLFRALLGPSSTLEFSATERVRLGPGSRGCCPRAMKSSPICGEGGLPKIGRNLFGTRNKLGVCSPISAAL